MKSATILSVVASLLPGVALAQQNTTQPGVPTKAPAPSAPGVKPGDIRPTRGLASAPAQPHPCHPAARRTLPEALNIAFQRSPSVLLATERAYRTSKQVDQITAIKGPQIGAGLTYTRLSGENAGGAAGGGGASPGQVSNPFPVGLQGTP